MDGWSGSWMDRLKERWIDKLIYRMEGPTKVTDIHKHAVASQHTDVCSQADGHADSPTEFQS